MNSLAAYAFVYISFKNKKSIFILIIASMFIPADAIFIANFITILNMNVLNTYFAIVITGIASAAGIFFMIQNFKKIPFSLVEAARIDGAGHFRIYSRIIMPLSKPALATWGVFSFLSAWNAYLWPLMVTTRQESRVIQVGLKMLISEDGTDWGLIMAAVVVIIFPSILALLFGQKYLQKSMTSGAVKG